MLKATESSPFGGVGENLLAIPRAGSKRELLSNNDVRVPEAKLVAESSEEIFDVGRGSFQVLHLVCDDREASGYILFGCVCGHQQDLLEGAYNSTPQIQLPECQSGKARCLHSFIPLFARDYSQKLARGNWKLSCTGSLQLTAFHAWGQSLPKLLGILTGNMWRALLLRPSPLG